MGKTKVVLLGICLLFIGAYTLHASTVERSPQEKQILRDKVAVTYTAQIGVMEVSTNWSPKIQEYLKTTNVTVSAPWCAALVSYCYTVNGIDNPRSAWSPSYFPVSKLINVKTTLPQRADLFGVWYNNMNRIAHVGFIDQWPRDGDYFISVEGNTNDNGSREGNGVYKKRRLKRAASKVSRWI